MKRNISIILSILICMLTNISAQEIKIMSFNMQQPNGTNWDGRVANVVSIINTHQPDILGSQELHAYMRDQILNKVSGYSFYGISRECDGSGESSYIFYKTNKYEVDSANSGTFWFKDDYLNCGRGYDPNYNRICSYVRLKEKSTGKYFYIYNSHFPTLDLSNARLKSATLLFQVASNRAIKDPVIFTGDFNSKECEKNPIEYIKNGSSIKMRDTYREIYPTGYATTGFNTRYDYIFIEDKLSNSTLNTYIVNTPVGSDHLPIVATVLLKDPTNSIDPIKLVAAKTSVEGDKIILSFNNELKQGTTLKASDFTISGGTGLSVVSAVMGEIGSKEIELIIDGEIMHDDSLKLIYNGSDISDTSNSVLPSFSNLTVLNRMLVHTYLPGKIEAENFCLTMGIDEEITSDTGGGNNIGWIDATDYAEYLVYVNTDTNYIATFRGAGNGGKGQLSIIEGEVKTSLCKITFKSTGDWQKWSNFQSTDTFRLSKGMHTIRYTSISGSYNVNYFNIDIATPKITSVETRNSSLFKVIPNPSNGQFVIQSNVDSYNLEVCNLEGKVIFSKKALNNGTFASELNLSQFSKGVYFLKVVSGSVCNSQKLVID